MAKKPDCERAIRQMIGDWRSEKKYSTERMSDAPYGEFRSRAEAKGYGHNFQFRSTMGPEYDAELWFAQETNQMWKR